MEIDVAKEALATGRTQRRVWLWVLFGALLILVTPFLALLATVVMVAIGGRGTAARVATTSAKLSQVESAVLNYELSTDAYPTGLNSLVPKYLRNVPLDGWQRPFVYAAPGTRGAPFDLYSLGPDGVAGTVDDVRALSIAPMVPVSAPVGSGK